MSNDVATPVDDESIQGWFGLSYSNYLVLPRTLLQSMPAEWQRRFVGCLEELDAAFAHVEQAPGYRVVPAQERTLNDLSREELLALGYAGGPCDCEREENLGKEIACRHDAIFYDAEARERQGWEREMVPIGADPVPHYDRGRAYVEPRLGTVPSA